MKRIWILAKKVLQHTLWVDAFVVFLGISILLACLIHLQGLFTALGLLGLASFLVAAFLGLMFAIPKIDQSIQQSLRSQDQIFGRLSEVSDTLGKLLLGGGVTALGFSYQQCNVFLSVLSKIDGSRFGSEVYLLIGIITFVFGLISFFLFSKLRLEPILLKSALEMEDWKLKFKLGHVENKERREL